MEEIKYLGSTIGNDGKGGKEVKKRIQAGLRNWKKVTGFVCDKNVPVRMKGGIHRAIIR